MKLARKENLYNNERTVTVYIKSFGSRNYSIEEEKDILDNYKPYFRYKDINFSGYYDKIDGEIRKINPTVTYTYNLSVDIPTTYTTGSGLDEHIVTIGINSISFTTSETENSDNFISVRNQAVLDFVKSDSKITKVFSADSISISDGKIKVTKSLVDEEVEQSDIDDINSSYGVSSVTSTQSSNQGGFPVSINVIDKKIEIKEGLECVFSFQTSRVLDSELHGQSKDVISEAKVTLFCDKVEEAIINKVRECKLKETKFEHKEEQELETEEF